MSRIALVTLVTLVAAVLLSACSTSSETTGPDYEPVPDQRLFAEATQVPGIEDADLTYNTTPGDRGYVGRVRLDPGLSDDEAGVAVSTVYAILRQGRFNQTIYVQPIREGEVVSDLPGVPVTGVVDELLEIYGPQPGDGTPPPR